MRKFITALLMYLALAGCATCEHHPYVCAVGGAIVVGSAVAIAEEHNHHDARALRPNYGICSSYSAPNCH